MMANESYRKKDEQLFAEVQKLKDGDFSNYNEVYVLSEKYMYKIINDIVKNHHTTEDLMQETYMQIYNKINTLQEVKAFYVWAGRIATNLTLRYVQKNSKEVLAMPDEEGETDFIFDTASEDTEKFIPESVLVDKEKQRLIAEIIDNLSTEQKICIQYFYYEEMSVNEIAQMMECSTGTVKSRLNYARKSIKEAVVDLNEKQGIKLYSLASAPLFLIVFRAVAEGGLLPLAVETGNVVNSAVSASRIEMAKTNNRAIQTALEGGSKAGGKQTAKGVGNIFGAMAKGFGAASLAVKVAILAAAVAVVGTGIGIGIGMSTGADTEENESESDDRGRDKEKNKRKDKDETLEVTIVFDVYHSENGMFYEQYRDEINALISPTSELYLYNEYTAPEEDLYMYLHNEEYDIASDSTALSENNLQELISYGLQFKDYQGEITEWGEIRYTENVNHEIVMEYDGDECICVIDEIVVYTINDSMEEYQVDVSLCESIYPDFDPRFVYKEAHKIYLKGTLSSVSIKNAEKISQEEGGLPAFPVEPPIMLETLPDEENSVAEDDGNQGDIFDPSNAVVVPGVTDTVVPSQPLEGVDMPELKLPTVESVRNIEQVQTMLYAQYARTNMTDEVFYSLMEQVPCTVYLQDGSSYSITLAEFISKDWSSYADLDKLDYDSEKAEKLSSGYVTTDSLIEN